MTFDPIANGLPLKAIIDGQETPGFCEITGGSTPRDWDERRAFAASYATLRFKGVKLGRPTLRLWLLTSEHFSEWSSFKQTILAAPQRGRLYVTISHPQLAEIGITTVSIADVTLPMPEDNGAWFVDVSLIEYRALQRIRPDAGGATSGGSAIADDLDQQRNLTPRQREIQALTSRSQANDVARGRYQP